MLAYLWVALGGALGSIARFAMSNALAARFGDTFPVGTLAVNVAGSLVIGVLAAWSSADGRWILPPAGRQFLMIGLCGGYTTFSSFSLQTFKLIQDREWLYAGGNIVLSVVLCMLGVWTGYFLATAINGKGA